MSQDYTYVQQLDLRGTPCPVNFVRCRLSLEALKKDQSLKIYLDCGEPELMVIPGLKRDGHCVEVLCRESTWLSLKVTCGAD